MRAPLQQVRRGPGGFRYIVFKVFFDSLNID